MQELCKQLHKQEGRKVRSKTYITNKQRET